MTQSFNTATCRLFGCLAISLFAAVPLLAQEEEGEVQSESAEMTVIGASDGSAPMIFSTSNNGVGFSNGGAFTMIGGPGGDFVMPAPDPWSMINNPSVQKDLELVGDQLDKVKELQQRQGEELRKQMGLMREGGSLNISNIGDFKETMSKMREQHREELKQLLLPHQIDRLHQVALQTHMRQAGTAGALANKKVAEELGISDEQIDRLKEKSKELKAKMEEKIKKLKEQMKQELLEELTSEQRRKLDAMTGDKYEPKDDDWRQSIQNRMGRFRSRNSSSSSDSSSRSGGN